MAGREVFLTGATGYLGGRLATLLAGQGHRLRCLVRDTSRAAPLEALGARIVQGDVTDDVALDHGLSGVDVAFHLAGVYDTGLVDRVAMERANVEGTRAVLRMAAHYNVPRTVHVSTCYALDAPPAGEIGPTDAPVSKGPYFTEYQRTKAAAHRIAEEAIARGLPVLIACPSFVYGPGDNGPGGRFIRDLLRRRVPGMLTEPAWFSHVHVDDVVEGLAAVGERGTIGGMYVLSGQALSVNEYATRVCELAGVRPPRFQFPVPVARVSAQLLDLIARPLGLRLSFTTENVDGAARYSWAFSHERASNELDYRARSLEDGLPETVEWFRREVGGST